MKSLFAHGGVRPQTYAARNQAIKKAVEEGHGHLVLRWLTSGGAALLYYGGWYLHRDCLEACEPLVEGLPTTLVVDAANVELKHLMVAVGVGDVEAVRTLVKTRAAYV